MATLTPIITGTPGYPPSYNVGMAETFSWIPVENDANRPLFARAGYITNLSDLTITLSAAGVTIGAIELKDGNSSRVADVEAIGGGYNALRVLTQDLESTSDSVAIGDLSGNIVGVNTTLSALNVFVSNPGQSNSKSWNIIPVIAPSGSFAALSSIPCNLVTIYNSTSATISIKRTGNNFAMPLKIDNSIDIYVTSNANEISVASTTIDLTASAMVVTF
jgi:hypothetical protein